MADTPSPSASPTTSTSSSSLLGVPTPEEEENVKRGIGTPLAERRRNAELRRQQEAERRAREEAERTARQAEEKRRLQEKVRLAKEEAARKKEEQERLAAEQKAAVEEERRRREEELANSKALAKEEATRKKEEQERLAAEQKAAAEEERRRREEELANSKALAKEEAARKKEEQERLAAEQRAAAEEERRRREEELANSKARAKEEAARKKELEQVEAQQRASEIEERRRREEEALRRHREEAARLREESERAAAEEKARRDEERQRAEEEARALVLRTAEEARRKKEELKAQKEQEVARLHEEQHRLIEERRRRREEELAAAREEKKRLEEEARRISEEKKEALRVQHQLAVQRHAEEVRRQQELEKDLEQEERAKAEALRAQQFAEEQRRRQEELEQLIAEEKERQEQVAAKVKELGLAPQQSVVNRIGLFREFGEEPGLEIWAVGDEQISKLPKLKHELRGIINESHGSFHVAKSYIVLHTSFAKGRRNFYIHSWVGSKAPELLGEQAEKRLTELEHGLVFENVLGVTRELEAQESEQFKAYFPEGIEYVQPVALRETEGPNNVEKRLYHIKGRNHVHVRRVPLSPSSLNSGDVFVLETQKYIFQWNGPKSNQMEKGKALDVCVQMRIERNARPRVLVLDARESSHELNLFWEALTSDANDEGGVREVQPVQDPEAGGDDTEYEIALMASFKLYRVAPSGTDNEADDCKIELVSEGREPRVEQLERSCCFVLDAVSELYVWYGSLSSNALREQALALGRELGSEAGREASAREPTVVRERSETILFKEKFAGSWGEYTDFDFSAKAPAGNIATLQQTEVNVDQLHHPEKYELAKEETRRAVIPPKDLRARTELEVWLIDGHDKVAIDHGEYGRFFSEHCYLVMFTVHLHDGDMRNAIYYWQGRDSSREDRGTSALIAGEIGTKLRFATVVRVVQNKEPAEFIEHFGTTLAVFRGARVPADQLGVRLLHVRGSSATTSYAIETGRKVSSLNSNDMFVLLRTGNEVPLVWRGTGSNLSEYESASAIARRYSPVVDDDDDARIFTDMEEGSEVPEFWAALEGDHTVADAYSNAVHLSRNGFEISCRMFTCSTAIGVFRVTEVDQPTAQDDLTPRDVIILDGLKLEIFVWIGPQATEQCQEMALETARRYIAHEAEDHVKYDPDTPLTVVRAGEEPVSFRAYFHAWDDQLAQDTKDPYAGRLRVLAAAQAKKAK